MLDLSLLLPHALPQGSLAPLGIWTPPWVFKSISHTTRCAGEGCHLISCSQQRLADKCGSCLGAAAELGRAIDELRAGKAERAAQPLEAGVWWMREPVRALQRGRN